MEDALGSTWPASRNAAAKKTARDGINIGDFIDKTNPWNFTSRQLSSFLFLAQSTSINSQSIQDGLPVKLGGTDALPK